VIPHNIEFDDQSKKCLTTLKIEICIWFHYPPQVSKF
jgi:hypothetical protein